MGDHMQSDFKSSCSLLSQERKCEDQPLDAFMLGNTPGMHAIPQSLLHLGQMILAVGSPSYGRKRKDLRIVAFKALGGLWDVNEITVKFTFIHITTGSTAPQKSFQWSPGQFANPMPEAVHLVKTLAETLAEDINAKSQMLVNPQDARTPQQR